MKICVKLIAENKLEKKSIELIKSSVSFGEIRYDENELSLNEKKEPTDIYEIRATDIARAADLLHAIRSVMKTAESYMPRK